MRGGGDRDERDLWRAAHRSKRMVQLRAILDTTDDNTARSAALRENFQALADIQRHDPGPVAELLGGPQVGAWAAQCLRLLSRGVPGPDGLLPHLAHLGGIAASAALSTGRHVRVRVPVRSGAVHFPSLGRALVAGGERELAECVIGPTGVLIDGVPPSGWHPVRLLRTDAGGVPLSVQVDDVDPYWHTFGIPATARLTDSEIATWQHHLDGAWQVLAERHAHRLHTITGAVCCLVPVQQAGRFGGASATAADAPGAVALTEPASPVRLAATLIHESQHFRLATLHDLHRLFADTSRHLAYSPWRNDPRPPSGVVHALMAFTGVADFWSRERTGLVSELEYARLVRQLRVAHRVATDMPDLTSLGTALVDALGDTITALSTDIGPDDVRRIADDLVAEHHAQWRLRTMVPDEDAVRATVRALERGDAPLIDMLARTGAPMRTDSGGHHPLTGVAMAWLQNAAEVRALTVDEELFAKRFPGAVASDLHLMAADYAAARDAALGRIADGTADDHTWATLAVVHGRACAAHSPLAHRPELVRAAFARLSPGGLGPLLTLMSHYEAGTSMSDTMRR
jgi:HEXXH motif-containing protein